MIHYEPRYTGTRWVIIYGSYEGVEKIAVDELYRKASTFFPYVLELYPAATVTPDRMPANLILIGTPQNNPWINSIPKDMPLPSEPQGYAIGCMESPWQTGRRVILLTGSDSAGVLYGTEDFITHILEAKVTPEKPDRERLQQAFDRIADFWIVEHPRIDNRGIWTWGYVIYDYQHFIDHMARLKLNRLTIWNDQPPVNAAEVIAYAHSRGIAVYFGFSWGWGMPFDLTKPEERQQIKQMVLAEYQEKYHHLAIDGIYFQTLTEHHHTELEGESVARLTCQMVNEIASALLELKPDLQIHFGLHATSILDRYTDLASLDKRVTIAWEDAGVLPYVYTPEIERSPTSTAGTFHLHTLAETLDYSKRLATFRPGSEFAIVPKGWSNLDWSAEFEHHKAFLLGIRDPAFIRERLRQRQPYWNMINALWVKNFRHAISFYREILACSPVKMTVTGLIEDGIFEQQIQLSVAIFAETLWNPYRDAEKILQRALALCNATT